MPGLAAAERVKHLQSTFVQYSTQSHAVSQIRQLSNLSGRSSNAQVHIEDIRTNLSVADPPAEC